MEVTKCPTCGSNKIKKTRRDWCGVYQKETYSVPDLEFYECPNCGEKVYDSAAMRKIETYSPAFKKLPALK